MISAQTVKELRDKTGAGMSDCKKALEEANGNMDEAIDLLRKRGAASSAKRADRDANEGIVVVRTANDGKTASIVEVNCETDFVARNEEFIAFANALGDTVLANEIKEEEQLWGTEVSGKKLGDLRDEMLAKFSEKIQIGRFARISTGGHITEYVHAGSRLGVLVELAGVEPSDEGKSIARDIAMQVAAMQPMFVNRSQVNQEVLDKELEIYKQQALQEGKKEDIAVRIAEGKLGKFYEENVLVEQTFVKDPSKKVSDIVAAISKVSDGEVTVASFVRYNLGER